jgi:CIC family chloride channel protein
MASFLHYSFGLPIQNTGIYAIIGMSAMMGACLQAPLAALTAVFEITTHHNIIWPSMLSIVVAQLVSRQLFKQPPVFDLLLNLRGLTYHHDPLLQSLQRVGVSDIMNQDFVCLSKVATRHTIVHLQIPDWIVIEENHMPIAILTGEELTSYLNEHPEQEAIDLTDIPSANLSIAFIDVRSTKAKAYEMFQKEQPDILCVTHWNQMTSTYILGIISRPHFNQTIL